MLSKVGSHLVIYLLQVLVTSGCSAVCLFSLVSNCSPPLFVYCIFLGPRGETVALVRYHRIVLFQNRHNVQDIDLDLDLDM